MYKERTESAQLSIPNVAVEIVTPDKPVILVLGHRGSSVGGIRSGGFYEFPGNTEAQRKEARQTREALRRRDWRELRGELIGLDPSDHHRIAVWLERVGYAPGSQSHRWLPDTVSDQLASALQRESQIISWLMTLEVEAFRSAVEAAHDYFEERRDASAFLVDQRAAQMVPQPGHLATTNPTPKEKKFRNPGAVFLRQTKAPAHLDPWILSQYLMGTGVAPSLVAWFMWDQSGAPAVKATVGTPLEVIGLSVHIDRNFSVRQWTTCERCGNGFERSGQTPPALLRKLQELRPHEKAPGKSARC